MTKKCSFPRFWALLARIFEKNCNFLHILDPLYISHYLPGFWPKSAHFLGFEHFFPKNVKKMWIFCNFCAALGPRICPILSPVYSVNVLKSWKKVQFFAHFQSNWSRVYVPWNRVKTWKKCLFPRFWAISGQKVQKKFNFLQFLCSSNFKWTCHISPINVP